MRSAVPLGASFLNRWWISVISTSYSSPSALAMVARSLNATLVATDMLGDIKIADLGALRRAEAGCANHRAGAGLGDQPEVPERRLGHRELDQHPLARDLGRGVRADAHAGLADARQLSGVPPEGGVARRLERGDEPEVGHVGEAGDDPIAHPSGSARDNDIRRRGATTPDVRGWLPADSAHGCYLIRPYGLRMARSFSRLASLIRHIGRRNSGSIMPAIAIASLIGMGLVSRNAARASGKSR